MSRPSWRAFGLFDLFDTRAAQVASLLLTAALGLASCAQDIRGEFSALECTNERDDDNDNLIDCRDPDCWVFCPAQRPGMIGTPDSMFPDAGSGDASPPDTLPDSGREPTMPGDDAGMSIEPPDPDDAGMPPMCTTCPAGEECIDGTCKPKSITGEYDISVRSAVVPLSTPNDKCFDYRGAAAGCQSRGILLCECVPPDPYVTILLNGKVLTRATSPEARGTASPSWTASPVVRTTLTDDSTLTFIVYDWDGIGSDTEIFRCSPDLAALSSGTDVLSCSPAAGMTIPPPRGTNYVVAVSVKKPPVVD